MPVADPAWTWAEYKSAVEHAAPVISRISEVTYRDYLEQVASCDRVQELRGEVTRMLLSAGRTVERQSVAAQYVEAVRAKGGVPDPGELLGRVNDLALSVFVWTMYRGCDPGRLAVMSAAVTSETWYDEAGRDEESFPFEAECERLFGEWISVLPAHITRGLVLTNAFIRDGRPASGARVTVGSYRPWRWMDSGIYNMWEGWLYAVHGTVAEGDLRRFFEGACEACRIGSQIAYFSHDLLTVPSDLVFTEPNVWLVRLAEHGDHRVSTAWTRMLADSQCVSGCASAPVVARHLAGSIVWSYFNGRYRKGAAFIRSSEGAHDLDLSLICGTLLRAIGGPEFATAIERSRYADALLHLQRQQGRPLAPAHVAWILGLTEHEEADWFASATASLVTLRGESIPAADLATDLLISVLTHELLNSGHLRSYLGLLDRLFQSG
ncbi:hypothetical protein Hesp01_74200 [Herbidospora sp. NBRC 101105]|nr:hypothetical protein Hesp01_74200 [Herbidospora sp. NBRC 101105]